MHRSLGVCSVVQIFIVVRPGKRGMPLAAPAGVGLSGSLPACWPAAPPTEWRSSSMPTRVMRLLGAAEGAACAAGSHCERRRNSRCSCCCCRMPSICCSSSCCACSSSSRCFSASAAASAAAGCAGGGWLAGSSCGTAAWAGGSTCAAPSLPFPAALSGSRCPPLLPAIGGPAACWAAAWWRRACQAGTNGQLARRNASIIPMASTIQRPETCTGRG